MTQSTIREIVLKAWFLKGNAVKEKLNDDY